MTHPTPPILSPRTDKPIVVVVGSGPAGLMAAETAARAGAHVTIFDAMPSPGRKFLLAGRGGLNLTHSEPADRFLSRYGTAASHLAPILAGFDAPALRAWSADLGVETFVGSSGRVFPASLKTSPLLRAWLRRLAELGVRLSPRHRWRGWDAAGRIVVATPDGPTSVAADALVLALGGASWPQLGSDGDWVGPLRAAGGDVRPLQPANCGFAVAWSEVFRTRFEGEPLKAVALDFDGHRARGDAVVTRAGLEGGAVYALAAPLRDAIARDGPKVVSIALRPDLPRDILAAKLAERPPKQSLANGLRKTIGLAPVAIGLLREAQIAMGLDLAAMDAAALAALVNAVPLRIDAPMPLARAISTAGGVAFDALDESLMLRCRPGVFVAGEMMDWEAPTGGYLLQACFATGRHAGAGAARWARDAAVARGQADAEPDSSAPRPV